MKILIACEESQAVTKEFRKLGMEAYSCDLLPCSGGHPEWHIQGDVRLQLIRTWDLVIAFPPCTDLTVAGARWFDKKRLSGEQEESIGFFLAVYNHSNCVENPIGIMNGGEYLKKWFPFQHKLALDLGVFANKPQIVQPYEYGDPYKKSTCLWLKKIPKLIPTNVVEPIFIEYNSSKTKSGKSKYSFMGKMSSAKNPEVARIRSKTPDGIAKAMAQQWGLHLLNI